jgi:hypothetical protein
MPGGSVLRVHASRGVSIALVLSLLWVVAIPQPAGAAGIATTVAEPCAGSSNPTFHPNNHRMVVTPTGRRLALFDPHGSGVSLAWRDGDGAWNSKSIFGVSDEVSSDRPASIALDGTGNAWVVWSGYNFSSPVPLRLRRLTDLDAPGGPTVGPVVTVQPAGQGNAFADLAFQGGRGFIVWLQRTASTSYSLKTIQFSQLTTDTPTFENPATLYSSSASTTSGTLVPTAAGMRVVARAGSLKVYSHSTGAQWAVGSASTKAPAKAKPSAVAFGNDILATFQAAPFGDDIVKVVRFSNTGSSVSNSLVTPRGYVHPSIAANASGAWVVMVAKGTSRTVVSRRFDGSGWGSDLTEISPSVTNGGDYAYPNALRDVDGVLRFLVDGKRCPTSSARNAVLAYERTV